MIAKFAYVIVLGDSLRSTTFRTRGQSVNYRFRRAIRYYRNDDGQKKIQEQNRAEYSEKMTMTTTTTTSRGKNAHEPKAFKFLFLYLLQNQKKPLNNHVGTQNQKPSRSLYPKFITVFVREIKSFLDTLRFSNETISMLCYSAYVT